MAFGDKQAQKLIKLAQSQISEPVIAAAIVSPKGKQGAMALGGLAGMAIHAAAKSDTGFASANLVAVTDNALYAFKASNNLGVKVKEPIGSWPWGAFGASTSSGAIAQFLFLGWVDGSVSELEAHARGVNKFQGAVIDEIVRRAGAAGGIPPQPR